MGFAIDAALCLVDLPLYIGEALTTIAGRVLLDHPSDRKRGWAESVGEREAGVASVSAPVRDRDGAVRAAVSVSGPIERMGRKPGDQFGRAVMLAALTIERGLGGPQPKVIRPRKR